MANVEWKKDDDRKASPRGCIRAQTSIDAVSFGPRHQENKRKGRCPQNAIVLA